MSIMMWGDGFEVETLINIRVAKAGLRVAEVPSFERRRIHGTSNLNAVKDGLRVLNTIRMEARREKLLVDLHWPEPVLSDATAEPVRLRSAVSVILVARGDSRWEDVLTVISALNRQTEPADETVLVVDPNSSMLAQAVEALPDTIVVPNGHTSGVSGARNTGVAVSGGEVLVFLQEDAWAEAACLEHLTAHFADPLVAVVHGRAEAALPDARPKWSRLVRSRIRSRDYAQPQMGAAAVESTTDTCLAVRRSVFDTVGTFVEGAMPTGQRALGFEAAELCDLLRQKCPEASLCTNLRLLSGKGSIPMVKRWRPSVPGAAWHPEVRQ